MISENVMRVNKKAAKPLFCLIGGMYCQLSYAVLMNPLGFTLYINVAPVLKHKKQKYFLKKYFCKCKMRKSLS